MSRSLANGWSTQKTLQTKAASALIDQRGALGFVEPGVLQLNPRADQGTAKGIYSAKKGDLGCDSQLRSAPAEPVVVCKDLWKIYGKRDQNLLQIIQDQHLKKNEVLERFGCVVGVAGVSFSIARGEVFCIMGLSGSGKSTLVRHVNRLIEPTSGQIMIDGEDVGTLDPAALRRLRSRKLGMVFQNVALFPHRTVRDNVAYGLEVQGVPKKVRYETVSKVISMVQLSGWESNFPDELSGGMQQRVGLARALAVNPEILLMDEPFGALDPLIRYQLQTEFLELSRTLNKTTIFITHDLDEAVRLGTTIAIMRDGQFVQTGTPEEIIVRPVDSYVARFAQGVSRLHVLGARAIMTNLRDPKVRLLDRSRSVRVSEHLSIYELIDVALKTEQPMIVVDESGIEIGIVGKDQLLSGIKGSPMNECVGTTDSEGQNYQRD